MNWIIGDTGWRLLLRWSDGLRAMNELCNSLDAPILKITIFELCF
jgi:hypothetical protein